MDDLFIFQPVPECFVWKKVSSFSSLTLFNLWTTAVSVSFCQITAMWRFGQNHIQFSLLFTLRASVWRLAPVPAGTGLKAHTHTYKNTWSKLTQTAYKYLRNWLVDLFWIYIWWGGPGFQRHAEQTNQWPVYDPVFPIGENVCVWLHPASHPKNAGSLQAFL